MLQVEYRLKLGQDEFVIKAEVKDEKEFFEQMSFYSSLPKTAPGGASDLKLSYRTTTEGHKYYSLVSEKEKLEFKFGQNKENKGGGLFPKGWEPLYQGGQDQQVQGTQSAGGTAGFIQPPQPQAPVQQQQQFINPAPQPIPQPQTFAPPIGQTAAPQPVQQTQPQAPANPQVNQVASNVLARFGINKQ